LQGSAVLHVYSDLELCWCITDYKTANGKITHHSEDTRVYKGRDTTKDRLSLLANLILPARMEKATIQRNELDGNFQGIFIEI
jgi:hypothetical protein